MMLYPSIKIKEHLSRLGIDRHDTVMVHGDAGVTAQYIFENDKDPIEGFFEELKSYFCEGTVLVPSFTYSATKGETFDIDNTPSGVGLFSEKFRVLDGVQRSQHPIFSICAFGINSEHFIGARTDDCFGDGTFFGQLYEHNAKILTLGCPLERATFVHHIEQKLNVSYRYFKKFPAKALSSGTENRFDVTYFVRDLKLRTDLNLRRFEKEALREGVLTIGSVGRFKARCIHAKDLFRIASDLILEDEYALIAEE